MVTYSDKVLYLPPRGTSSGKGASRGESNHILYFPLYLPCVHVRLYLSTLDGYAHPRAHHTHTAHAQHTHNTQQTLEKGAGKTVNQKHETGGRVASARGLRSAGCSHMRCEHCACLSSYKRYIHGSLRRGAGVFEADRDAADSSGCDCEAVAAVDEVASINIMAGVAAASAASAYLR